MFETRVFTSIDSLQHLREDWNELWLQSDSHSVRTRFESLELFVRHLGHGRPMHVVTVHAGAKLVAAIPLLIGKRKGLRIAELPNDSWSLSGDLLMDREFYRPQVVQSLVEGINQAPVLATWLDWIDISRTKWQLLRDYLTGHQYSHHVKERFPIAMIDVPGTHEEFQQAQSRNHRKKMKRARRRLAEIGKVELVQYESNDLEGQLEIAFAMEHRGWKGEQGSSIRANPEMESYFRQLAHTLHNHGSFALEFLTVDGKPIAYDMGSMVKGVRASQKVSFDPDYATFSPGQLLIDFQMDQAIQHGDIQRFDTVGPTTDAIRKWTRASYPMGRLVLSNHRWTSRVSVRALSQLSNVLNRIRNGQHEPDAESPEPVSS